MADRGVPTVSELKKFKVVELKAKLQELGLPVNGLKADLIERLQEFYLEQSREQQNKQPQVAELQVQHAGQDHVAPVAPTQNFPALSPTKAKPGLPVQLAGIPASSPQGEPVVMQLKTNQPVSPQSVNPGIQPIKVPITPPGTQQMQMQSLGAQSKSPIQLPMAQVSPLHSPGAQQTKPVIIPLHSPTAQPKSPQKSPGARQVSPVGSPGTKLVFPQSVGAQVPFQGPGGQPVFLPMQPPVGIMPLPQTLETSKIQPPITSLPGIEPVEMKEKVTPIQEPSSAQRQKVLEPDVTAQQRLLKQEQSSAEREVTVTEAQVKKEDVLLHSLPTNLSQPGSQNDQEDAEMAQDVQLKPSLDQQDQDQTKDKSQQMDVSEKKPEERVLPLSQVPPEQTEGVRAEHKPSAVSDEEKMSTDQQAVPESSRETAEAPEESAPEKELSKEKAHPTVKEKETDIIAEEKRQVKTVPPQSRQWQEAPHPPKELTVPPQAQIPKPVPHQQLSPRQNLRDVEMQEHSAIGFRPHPSQIILPKPVKQLPEPPRLEQRQMAPHPPEKSTVLLQNQIPQLSPRQNRRDAEVQERSVVGPKMPPRHVGPPKPVEQMTEDSGIEMSEPHTEDVSYEGDQEAIAMERAESKGKKKKKKKKKRKQRQQAAQSDVVMYEEDEVEVEYVPEQIDATDPNYRAFAKIFEAFKLSDEPVKEKEKAVEKKEEVVETKKTEMAVMKDSDESDEEDKPIEDDKPKISKKKLRKMNRLSVAELKQLVPRPDVVEMHDVTAQDPKLLVFLKSCRNTVPVPRHWCFKRKYLQGKRGIIKSPFELPEFIKKTGIMEMREAMQEKEEQKTLKAKMREKVRPKMGKINIDYQKLHDAFFKWQTKPKMTIHGDLYYEGKEFETKLKEKKPGDLSEELRTALGMPVGPGSNLVPPPWLIAMQRYGPPPSYPNLKIPGLNAAIPEGASFGYHAGGWGKPPVDETGRPLYGDVFGTQQTEVTVVEDDDQVDKAPWGELESEEESEESSEEESEEEEDQTGLVTPADTGLVTPSGLTSIPAGMETPDMIELRKRKTIEDAMETGAEQPSLYTVLPERRAAVGGAAMMGSAHVYDINAAVQPGIKKVGAGAAEGIEVALDPSELELDPLAMQARYEEQMKERESQLQKEDLSDMVAEHAAKQQKKRKKATDSGKAAKKYKEFKF